MNCLTRVGWTVTKVYLNADLHVSRAPRSAECVAECINENDERDRPSQEEPLKDGSKISYQATRFLPVDMKDRLKSAFNRNSNSAAARDDEPAEDSDFTAIFNPSRSSHEQLKPPVLDRIHSVNSLARNPARQVAADVEEAEIIGEADSEPTDSTQSGHDEQLPGLGVTVGEPAPISLTSNASRPTIEAQSDTLKRGESVSNKSKSRFFGDFSSTESVRLKVEKRNEKRPEPVSAAFNVAAIARSESRTAELTILGAERGARPAFALETEPGDHPNGNNRIDEGVVLQTAASKPAHINLLEEYDAMEANEHESGNGAVVPGDSGTSAPTFAIERNSKFSGQLKFSGAITIEGQVDGELIAEKIVIHEGGIVHASVNGNTVVIGGMVKGDVCANHQLEILPTGVVDGSVTAPAIIVRRGARVEGLCAIGVPRP
jgi:cytoskeletal protein CcmA (bactofilin family)